MEYISSAYWDIGIRKTNEDSLILEELKCGKSKIFMAAVADGIGGLTKGEVASGYAIEELTKCFHEEAYPMLMRGKNLRKLKRIFLSKLHSIYESLRSYGDINGISLGTTLSMLILYRNHYMIIHLGDSGIFRIRHHRSKQLTIMHAGADGSLIKCLGSMTFHMPQVKIGYYFANTGFLLATDGFFKKMKIDGSVFEPKEISQVETIERRLGMVGRRLRNMGEKDNMAAIYVSAR